MKKVLLLAALCVAAKAESICGRKYTTPDAEIQIICVPWGKLAALGLPMEAGKKDQTQVFVYPRVEGRAVEITLGEETQVTRIIPSQAGPVAGWAFDGTDYETLPEVFVLVRK